MTISVGDVIERRYHATVESPSVWLPVKVTHVWRDALYYGTFYVLLRDEGVTWRRVPVAEDETK